MAAFAAAGLLALIVALSGPISLRSWQDNIGRPVRVYFASALPFLAQGFAVSIAISSAGPAIGRIYARDLNDATRVVGPILTMFVSVNAGFTSALIAGTAAYAVAAVILPASLAEASSTGAA
ncbi:MAG: hypothetical protein AAGC55_00380 [Myxococcota bacterium]